LINYCSHTMGYDKNTPCVLSLVTVK